MKTAYYDIHTHRAAADCISVISFSAGYEPVPPSGTLCSAGIHPWYIPATDMKRAEVILTEHDIVALGECGLDYHIDFDRTVQQEILRMQLNIAVRRGLPVVIHCVKAYNDITKILNDYGLGTVIFHNYTGSPQQTENLWESGYYFSFGPSSFSSPKTVDSLKALPPDRIFAETDNSNQDVMTVYEEIARLRGVDTAALAIQIQNNYKKVFKNAR